jgi:predicted dehydrogenase
VSLLLEDGIVGSLHCAYVMPGGLADAYHTGFDLWGDAGDIAWTPVFTTDPTVRVRSVRPEWAGAPERTFGYRETLAPTAYCGKEFIVDYFRDMLRRLVAGEDHVVTGADALRVVEICEAAYQSAATGRRVDLPPSCD